MSGYSCDQCKHRSCYIWANDGISDDECEGIQKGHPCKPVWEWNAPEGVPDPRELRKVKQK